MSIKQENQAQENNPEIVPVEDLDQFVNMLTAWHTQKVAQVKHMLTIPEGTTVELREGEEIVLEGQIMQAFLIGIHTALAHLGELPFVAEVDETQKADEG